MKKVFDKVWSCWRIGLNTPRGATIACFLVPMLFGFYSLWLGADANWDLYNYHLYNPYAWIHDKLLIDLAPAGMQSYFNPLLDVPLYLANLYFPSRVVGFAAGVLHGLTFILVLGIARCVLPGLSEDNRHRGPILLALAGCLTASFLSELGNSMGDDTTALFVLSGLLLVLSKWEIVGQWTLKVVAVVVGAGFVVGLGAGLKLTNAIYAIALCAAFLGFPGRPIVRLRLAFFFGIGVLLGMATTGGYWLVHMWKVFGNPLYPQFGVFFPHPLIRSIASSDTRWLPHGFFESVLWPFVFSADSFRVSEAPIRQIIWPIAYVLFWCWLGYAAVHRLTGQRRQPMDPRQRFVILFVALAYLAWMKLFSIYRYLVAVDVLTPIVVTLLLQRLLPRRWALYAATGLIGAATVVVIAGGVRIWDHEGWSDPLVHAETPPLAEPGRTTVVIASGVVAWGWLVTQFPPAVAFTTLESSFPATPAFNDRMKDLAKTRGGPVFGVINGQYNQRLDSIASANAVVEYVGLNKDTRGCDFLRWVTARLRLHASVQLASDATRQCELGLRRDDARDLVTENRALSAEAVPVFDRNGFVLDAASCVPYRAGIGKRTRVYQWCRLTLKTP